MQSVLRLVLIWILLVEACAPSPARADALNVLPLAVRPRAQASPPSRLPRSATARMPRAFTVSRPHVLAPVRPPSAAAAPTAMPYRYTARGFARGIHLSTNRQSSGPRFARQSVAASSVTLISEAFANAATTANAWLYEGNACLTAGNAQQTPSTSVPACGANAPQDPAGAGALELTPPVDMLDGGVYNRTPLPTANGLSINFNFYSFGASASTVPDGDGFVIALNDATKPLSVNLGGCCGSLGYAARNTSAAVTNGYLGIGLDESGYFSAANESKTGGLTSLLPNTIAVRGAAATNAQYLFGFRNAGGLAATLPFSLNSPAAQTRPPGIAVNVTLTAGGLLGVNIDRHDGNGFVAYLAPTQVAGVNGQPALPTQVYLGFIAATGGTTNGRHQISNVVATTLPTAASQVTAETFTGAATTANGWAYGDDACITAGTTATPTDSIPACGSNAPQDPAGGGALQLTPAVNFADGYALNRTPFATSAGVSITFNSYSFHSSSSPGDGLALVLTDASKPLPTGIGGCCGSLGYAPHGSTHSVLANGYLGIGFDETGYYTSTADGKTGGTPGLLPDTISVRGAASTQAQYLFGALNTAHQPAPLPFGLYTATTTRPAAQTVNVTLTSSGLLSVAIDRRDGNGAVSYIPPTQVVGVNGQPALPASVYFGFIAAGGGANTVHQINNVSVTGAGATNASHISMLTYHNDVNRTGWNTQETSLTTSNVKPATFGLLHTTSVDGRVDAQPLVVASQAIDGQGTHDVVYVVTENDSVYAIDAQSGAILTSRTLGQSISNAKKDYDDNIYPTYGILSTPVIDPINNAIYVVSDTYEGTGAPDIYRLHKLALNNLGDLVPSVVIAPATKLSDGSAYAFSPQHERQHPGLLEANGNVYVAFGSTGDTQPTISRGVIAGFNAATLAPLSSNAYADRLKQVSDPYYLSSIWQSGFGPAADSTGNIYFATGNSDYNAASYAPGYNYPDSVLKVSGDLSTIRDSFTQYDYFAQDKADGDLGAGGTLVVPDQNGIYPHIIVAGGKDGKTYILNRDNLGGFTANGPNKDLLELNSGATWGGPAYFVGADKIARIATSGRNGLTTWKLVDGAGLSITLDGRVSQSLSNGQPDYSGSVPVISSNGTQAGSSILWFVQKPVEKTTLTLNLRAFDALNVTNEIFSAPAGNWSNYNSNANVVPTVVNGRVYVGSYKQLQIFGLLGH